MTYEYNVPHVDFVREFGEDDGADAFFDINEQLERKLKLSDSETCESNSEENVPPLQIVEPKSSTSDNMHDKEKRENAVLQEITGSVQNIRERTKRKSDADVRVVKFISLAEGICEFQRHPRDIFNSRSAIKGKATNRVSKTHVTIPQSPMLLSKTRIRPVNYPSAEERTRKEIEEMESYKLKAKPLNRKIFEPPQLGRRISRAPLVVEPFNLTEYKKKEIEAPSSPYHFKAKPVPKGMLQHPCGIPEKKSQPVTSPHTPSFVSKWKMKFQTIEEVNGELTQIERSPSHTNVPMGKVYEKTCPCPFSFEERDKLMMKNREEKIKKVLQEEREARNFHANPVPAFIKKKDVSSNSSVVSSETSFSNQQEKKVVFKARPATVLHKSPFQPKLPERSCTPPNNVMLRTQQRAESRKEYDEHLKQRAEEIEAEILRRKKLQEQREEEEVALLRQKAVLKAQPIRHYKPLPERQKPVVTSPSTPKFSERLKPE